MKTKKKLVASAALVALIGSAVIADDLKNFIAREEGARLCPYDDATGQTIKPGIKIIGNPTVGYGHKLLPGEDPYRCYTEEEIDTMLDKDIQKHTAALFKCAPELNVADLPVVAFGSFTFHAGPSAACNSTPVRLWKEGQKKDACLYLRNWNKTTIDGKKVVSPGIEKRRQREIKKCLQGKGVE
jgi:lysozyme